MPAISELEFNELETSTTGDSDEFGTDGEERSSQGTSGESWLSNAAIEGAIPTNKLRTAIEYHTSMAAVLRQELALRSAVGYRNRPKTERARSQGRRTKPVPVDVPKLARRRPQSAATIVSNAVALLGLDFVRAFLDKKKHEVKGSK